MNTDNTLNIGVVGVGHLGMRHVEQLKEVAEANLSGIFDLDRIRIAEIASQFGVTSFESFDALIENVDALSIVTPTVTHFELASQAIKAGKHVFIEKPITTTLEQADALIKLSAEQNCKIQVGHIERFNPAIMALDPLLIEPLFIEAHRMANFNPRGTDVAVVMDLMIHDIDLILSFVQSPVVNVQASGVSIISQTEDIANCRLEFENGCVANVTASRISNRKMRKMRFFQPDAYISVDFIAGVSEVYHIAGDEFPAPSELAFSLGQIEKGSEKRDIRYTRLQKSDVNPLRHELSLFCKSIMNDTPPPVTATDGARALRIAAQILESIDEHIDRVRKQREI